MWLSCLFFFIDAIDCDKCQEVLRWRSIKGSCHCWCRTLDCNIRADRNEVEWGFRNDHMTTCLEPPQQLFLIRSWESGQSRVFFTLEQKGGRPPFYTPRNEGWVKEPPRRPSRGGILKLNALHLPHSSVPAFINETLSGRDRIPPLHQPLFSFCSPCEGKALLVSDNTALSDPLGLNI